MVSEFDVKFVVRDHNLPRYKSITHIGGELSSGDPWQIPVTEAIQGIQTGRFAFTIARDAEQRVQLMVTHHPLYGQLLKSTVDGRDPESLMALPERRTTIF